MRRTRHRCAAGRCCPTSRRRAGCRCRSASARCTRESPTAISSKVRLRRTSRSSEVKVLVEAIHFSNTSRPGASSRESALQARPCAAAETGSPECTRRSFCPRAATRSPLARGALGPASGPGSLRAFAWPVNAGVVGAGSAGADGPAGSRCRRCGRRWSAGTSPRCRSAVDLEDRAPGRDVVGLGADGEDRHPDVGERDRPAVDLDSGPRPGRCRGTG